MRTLALWSDRGPASMASQDPFPARPMTKSPVWVIAENGREAV